MPSRRPPSSAMRDAGQPGEHGRRDRGDEQGEEVVIGDLREERREQHAGEAGEQARQHPRERADPVGVDAGSSVIRGLSTTARIRRPRVE